MSQSTDKYSAYRWVILGLAWLVLLVMVWSWFLIPSLAHRLFPDLKLNQVQFTLIFTAPFLIGILTPILGGALGDRFGIRGIVALAAFIAGLSGIARAYAGDFATMFTIMCFFGISYGIVMPNLPKLVGVWFPPTQMGLASGIYMTGLNIGAACGLLTGPMFSGWPKAFFITGVVMTGVAILWTLLAKSAPPGVNIQMPPVMDGIKRGLTSKNVWFIAFGQCLYLGAFVGFSGNFPNALITAHNVSPETAGAISSLLTWGLVIGNFFLPIISDRVGLRKPFVYVGATLSAICFFFAWYWAPGVPTWVLIFIGGVIFGGIQPILFTALVELPEIGPAFMGGASGVVATFLNAGGFILPLMVTAPLIAAGTLSAYTTGFFVTAAILLGIVLLTVPLRETGVKAAGRD